MDSLRKDEEHGLMKKKEEDKKIKDFEKKEKNKK